MFAGSFSESLISFSICSSDWILAESSLSTEHFVSLAAPSHHRVLVPWPSFSRTALEVENAAYLGIEVALRVCCSIEVRGTDASVLGWHRADCLNNERGRAREKLLRDIIL